MTEATIETYLTASEIAGLIGKSTRTVQYRAKKENWPTKDTPERGKTTYYITQNLPQDIQSALSTPPPEQLLFTDDQTDTTTVGNNPEAPATETSGPQAETIGPHIEPAHTLSETEPDLADHTSPEATGEEATGEETPTHTHPFAVDPEDTPAPTTHQPSLTPTRQQVIDLPDLRKREIDHIAERIMLKSIIILGQAGSGKTHTLEKVVSHLKSFATLVHFTEPPTAKTLLLNMALTANLKPSGGATKEDLLALLDDYQGTHIFLAIDQLERMTPQTIDVLDRLLSVYPWFRFLGAGHLGFKKKHNPTWFKCHAYRLQHIGREQSMNLINHVWPDGDQASKKTIINTCRGNPGQIIKIATDAKNGVMPQEQQRYMDFTPIVIIIATIGAAFRVIGYGYQSPEAMIVGGVVASVFMGLFWVFRGYQSGWFGTRNHRRRDK